MRYVALIVVVFALAACGGGSSSTTLRGTFTDDADVANASAPCSSEELGGAITVAVDNVPAGSAAVTWQGNPHSLTTLGGSILYACSGTWQITVPSAKISYILGISGLGGVSGTVTVPVSQSGQSFALDDNQPNGNGGSLLEVAPGGSESQPSASQVAPGSAVVPCSQIVSQIKAIEPYYGFPGPNDSTPLYGLETALANKFGNVSNLDNPQNLANAEVAYELAVQDSSLSQNQPFSTAVQDDIGALAAACGIG
jgi:hypothetical protein